MGEKLKNTAAANSTLYNVDENVTFTGKATATRMDNGTTDMGLAVEQFENTNANFDVTFTVTDGYQAITPALPKVPARSGSSPVSTSSNRRSIKVTSSTILTDAS